MTSSERWPKPLEPHIKDLTFLIDTAHDEHSTFDLSQQPSQPLTPNTPKSTDLSTAHHISRTHLLTLRDISTLVTAIEDARKEWWNSEEKRRQRAVWTEKGEEAKLVGLQKVNNKTIEGIEAVRARLGVYVRWSLGFAGGIAEVEEMV